VVCSVFFGGETFLKDCEGGPGYPTPTWYSAVPTMHEAILLDAEARLQKGNLKHSLTLMRNCSAALLPPVSKRFLAAFGAVSPAPFTVVPTYAMTESFPICSNPPHLEVKLSTVGPAMGPHLKILNGHPQDEEVEPGAEGEVCVTGPCVTAGYLIREHMSADPNIEAYSLPTSKVGRMLRTGDKGYVDADGYLQLVGRFKEIINCGGEKISPLELEDQLLGVKGVETCVCFSTPAELLGEVVAVACVVKKGATPPDIDQLRAGVKTVGNRFKPCVLVYMDAIPKGPTGKPKRIGLSQQLKIPTLLDGVETYSVKGVGNDLGPLIWHAKKLDGTPVQMKAFSFPMTIQLDMNPDLGTEERSTHILYLEEVNCAVRKLTIGTYADKVKDEEGDPPIITREVPITLPYAKEAVEDVLYRATHYGLDMDAEMASEGRPGEDFAADYYVYDGEGNVVLRHSWRVGCKTTPPGRMMRLVGVLHLEEYRKEWDGEKKKDAKPVD